MCHLKKRLYEISISITLANTDMDLFVNTLSAKPDNTHR